MPNRRRSSLKRSRVGFQHWRWTYISPYPKRQHLHQSAPLFHRVFKRWLKEHRSALGLQLEITARHQDSLSLRPVGYPDCLVVSASLAEISVAVICDGQFIDYLLCLDMSDPVIDEGRVLCDACRPESRTLYPSLESYWQGHQFDPFGRWLTNKLAPAKWLGIYQNCAELTIDEPKGDELIKAIQLR